MSLIKRTIAKQLLKRVPVTPKALIEAGFMPHVKDFTFGNLVLFRYKEQFYYYKPDAERVTVKNMQEVSDLVYGHTPFLDISNA